MKIEQATGKNATVTITTRDDEKKGIIKLDGGILVWKGSESATPAEANVIHNERNLMTGKTIVENAETDQDTLDWATLKKLAEIIAEEETIDNDTKEVEVTYGGKNYKLGIGDIAIVYYGTAETKNPLQVRLLGFNHDRTNRETGISFEFKEFLGQNRGINGSNTNEGGWGSSDIRTDLNNASGTYLPNIKDAATGGNGIAQYIKEVNKPYNIGYNTDLTLAYSNSTSTGDKLWLLSLAEIGWSITAYDRTAEGTYYSYYNYAGIQSKGNRWWLRTPRVDGQGSFFGIPNFTWGAMNACGIAPGFTI